MTRVWLAVLLVFVGSIDCSDSCPGPAPSCPAAYLGASVAVVTMPAAVVNGVQAVLAGPVNGTMRCQPNPPVSSVVCDWPLDAGGVMPGNYSLQVSAPGYETTTIQVKVTTPPPGPCGCSFDSIEPSVVSIGRTDGAVD